MRVVVTETKRKGRWRQTRGNLVALSDQPSSEGKGGERDRGIEERKGNRKYDEIRASTTAEAEMRRQRRDGKEPARKTRKRTAELGY